MCKTIYTSNIFQGIREAKEELGNPATIWYRGHSNQKYKLKPSLYRFSNGREKEVELFFKYQQLCFAFNKVRNTDWDTLFDMQHFGIPTRLLDWTDVAGIALFFSFIEHIHRSDLDQEPCLFLLDPSRLNKVSRNKQEIIHDPNNDLDYKKVYIEKNPFEPIYPIAIEPIYTNDRITAQRGKFTIFGSSTNGLEDDVKESVVRIVFDLGCLQEANEFLAHSNINEYTIFPDIYGAAAFIRRISNLLD